MYECFINQWWVLHFPAMCQTSMRVCKEVSKTANRQWICLWQSSWVWGGWQTQCNHNIWNKNTFSFPWEHLPPIQVLFYDFHQSNTHEKDSFPRKTFISLISNTGPPSYRVNIVTDGIDNWSMGETSISSASVHLTSQCQVHFIYIERTWVCISVRSKEQLLDITESTSNLVFFAFVFIDFCLLSVANLYYTGIQQSQTRITLNGLSSMSSSEKAKCICWAHDDTREISRCSHQVEITCYYEINFKNTPSFLREIRRAVKPQ